MAQAYEDAAWEALSAAREKIEDATYSQLMLAACQATDKMRLLRDEPTQIGKQHNDTNTNIDVDRLTADERDTLVKLIERARTLTSGVASISVESGGMPRQPIEVHAASVPDPQFV